VESVPDGGNQFAIHIPMNLDQRPKTDPQTL